jgi:hypothetical protein
MENFLGLMLVVIAIALFIPKKRKKPKLKCLKGGKYDPNTRYE